jgi:hypothetical protein
MEVALREAQQLLNDLKKERQHHPDPENRPLNAAVLAAEDTRVAELPTSDQVQAPDAAARPPAGRNQMISYSVDRDQYEAARETLGASGPRDVGLETFKYYYDAEV